MRSTACFWHRSGLLANAYRGEKRCLSTVEIREYLQRTFGEEAFYCGPSNERFRRQLYDVYLGGLDKESSHVFLSGQSRFG